jgi:hypothetical protein
MPEITQVLKYGGGTQSIALVALMMLGKVPWPDLMVIADTSRERSTTWKYLDEVVNPALAPLGKTIHRPTVAQYAYRHEGVFNRTGTLLIPAFTKQGTDVGKMSGFCNSWWKQEVVKNWLRRTMGISPRNVCSWIGFSLDEYPRVLRMMAGDEYKEGRIKFPLIDLMMKRRDSISLVEEMGWPTPPRSACYMCPNQNDDEWRDLKANHPAEFALAVQEERAMQARDPAFWLHDSCKPLDTVDFTRPDDLFMRACDAKDGAACFT